MYTTSHPSKLVPWSNQLKKNLCVVCYFQGFFFNYLKIQKKLFNFFCVRWMRGMFACNGFLFQCYELSVGVLTIEPGECNMFKCFLKEIEFHVYSTEGVCIVNVKNGMC